MINIRRAIKMNIDKCLERSVLEAKHAAMEEAENIRMSEIPAGTWKAICRRNGIPYRRKDASYDWVETFTEPFANSYATPWKLVFEAKIPEIHRKFSASIIEALREFQTSLMQSSVGICDQHIQWQQLLSQIPLLEDLVKERVADSLDYSEASGQETNREVGSVVLTALQPLYEKLNGITGEYSRMLQMA